MRRTAEPSAPISLWSRTNRLSLDSGGDSGARTRSLRLAKPALSQLSYIPNPFTEELCGRRKMVGLSGLEPPTSRLSGVRSNQLSYRPTKTASWGVRAWCTVRSTPSPGSHREATPDPGPSTDATGVAPADRAPEREKNSARDLKTRKFDLGLCPRSTEVPDGMSP